MQIISLYVTGWKFNETLIMVVGYYAPREVI
jgi:hypothetical protein